MNGWRRAVGGARSLSERTALWVKLVAATLALVAFALLATGVAAAAALRGFLVDQLDDRLRSTAPEVAGRVAHGIPVDEDRGPGRAPLQPADDFYVRLSNPDGTLVGELLGGELAGPALGTAAVADAGREPFTVAADGGGPDWRVIVTPLPGSTQTVAVAYPLDHISATVGRLVAIDLVVGAAVIVLLGGVGYAAVRSSLRPLVEVEHTAAAIAAGDLSRRVPERDRRTEVGRLGAALNGMLAQIETAFRAREASEASARASEDRMRRFVADASHELRTPLTSIRGFAELYRQGAAPEPQDIARVMRRIEDEAARMGLLVEDLLLLARLDQQRPLERRPVDLLALAGDAVHDAQAVDPDRPVRLRVLDGDEPPLVTGDEHRLRQVVANLVSNAISHTPAGTPVTVTVGTQHVAAPLTAVTARPADQPGGAAAGRGPVVAVLEVADAGPGLEPADAARVFERFYRVDTSRTRAAGGSGLGLSIVSALVAAHGGTVGIDTAPGRGTTFRVLLPLGLSR